MNIKTTLQAIAIFFSAATASAHAQSELADPGPIQSTVAKQSKRHRHGPIDGDPIEAAPDAVVKLPRG